MNFGAEVGATRWTGKTRYAGFFRRRLEMEIEVVLEPGEFAYAAHTYWQEVGPNQLQTIHETVVSLRSQLHKAQLRAADIAQKFEVTVTNTGDHGVDLATIEKIINECSRPYARGGLVGQQPPYPQPPRGR